MEKGGISRRGLRVVANRPIHEHEYAEPIGAVKTDYRDDLGTARGILLAVGASLLILGILFCWAWFGLALERALLP